MQLNKLVYDKVVGRLKEDISNIARKRNANRNQMNRLAEEQKLLKIEHTILIDLIREIEGKKGK